MFSKYHIKYLFPSIGSIKHSICCCCSVRFWRLLWHRQSTPRLDRRRVNRFLFSSLIMFLYILSNVWPPSAPRRCRPATSPQAPLILHGLPSANLVLRQSLARISSLRVQKTAFFSIPQFNLLDVRLTTITPAICWGARGSPRCCEIEGPKAVTSAGGRGGSGGSTVYE